MSRSYTPTGAPGYNSDGSSLTVRQEFDLIKVGFEDIEGELDGKADAEEIIDSRGTKTTLADRLSVSMNNDGTLKPAIVLITNILKPEPVDTTSGDVAKTLPLTQDIKGYVKTSADGNVVTFLAPDGTSMIESAYELDFQGVVMWVRIADTWYRWQ